MQCIVGSHKRDHTNAVYAANLHFGRCSGCQVIANANKTMCGRAVQSSALTTGTHESLNWKVLHGIARYMHFLCKQIVVCVRACVYIFGFLAKLTLTNCSYIFIVTTEVMVTPSAAGTQIQRTLKTGTVNIIQPYFSSTWAKFCPHWGSSSPNIAQLMTHNL